MAIEAELADGRILEFPDGTDPSVIQATVKRVLASSAPPTTIGGNIKEAVKGFLPGAVGLVETAATGASALLPEDMEKAARAKIASVAGAAKAPFAATPGYEESVGRRLGEGLGSILPVAPLGFLGVPGALAGVGVGLAAGAGEARTKAEQEGATAEQRSKATAMGTIPGGFDTAVDMALAALPGGIGKSLSVVRRALLSGGVEGATEAAQAIAQNAIARGVYKPDQALLEGAGEEGAYGAGVGAIASVLLDMAIPGRTRGAAPKPPAPPPPPPGQLPPTAPPGTQGALFTPEEMGPPVTPPAAPAAEPIAPGATQPTDQLGLGLEAVRQYSDLVQERERLRQQEQTPEVKARIDQLTQDLIDRNTFEIDSLRAQKEQETEGARRFPALAAAPQVEPSPQGDLFGGTEDFALPERKEAAPAPTIKPGKAPVQPRLPLRPMREGVTRETPEPTITSEDIMLTAIPLGRGVQKWVENNVWGRTRSQLQDLVTRQPDLVKGSSPRARLLRVLTAPEVPSFQEAINEPATAAQPTPESIPERGRDQQGLELPSGPTGPGAVGGVPATPGRPARPVRRRLALTGESVSPGGVTEVPERGALSEPKDVGYHAGNLGYGRDTTLGKMAGGRSTGHFGTGVYFVGAPDKIPSIYRDERPVTTVDLSKYNLAKPRTSIAARALHDGLKTVNNLVGNDITTPDAQAQIDRAVVNIDLGLGSSVSRDQLKPVVIKAIQDATIDRTDDVIFESTYIDSASTRVMKALGFDGVDVRGIPGFDNTEFGTVVYSPSLAPAKPTGQTEEKRAANKAAQPTAKKAKETKAAEAVAKPVEQPAPTGTIEALVKSTEGKENLPEEAPDVAAAKPLSAFHWRGKPSEFGAQLQKEADEARRSVGAKPGQTLESLQKEIESGTSILHTALRQMLKSGKVKLESKHPSGERIGGLFDGRQVTLYADGIPTGDALAVAMHEVAAHLGMRKLLGDKQYNAVIDRILDMAQSDTASPERALAQRALARIPKADIERGAEVSRDEAVAYFVEELAKAEASGELPKVGPLRALWNQVKAAIVRSINKALGTSFGINSFTADQIGELARSAFVAEAKTGVEETAPIKQQFSVSYSTEQLVDSMGDLSPPRKSALRSIIDGFKSQAEPSVGVKFRTQVADIAASIERRLHEKFNGAVRDSLGNLNPMGLYRQAQDYTKMLLEYFQQGSLVKDKTTGLWKVTTAGDVSAPAKVYDLLDAWGKKNGYSFDRATQIASRILEGVRLNEMRESNRTQGTEFLLHLTDAQIDQLVAEYRADPDLKALSDAMDAPRKALVDKMVEAGRLSPEMGQQWKDVIGYVPFDRIDDFESKFNKIKKVSGRGIAQLGKLPELVGSKERPVGNVFDNYLNTLGWMVGQTLKNDASVQTLRALEDIGQAKFLGNTPQFKDNTASAYVNGEQKFWELPSKYDVMAFKDLLPPKAGYLKLLGEASIILRTTVTALPPFALKQVVDDIQRAILTSGVKSPTAIVWRSLTNFPKLALAELRGIRHPIVRDAEALGFSGAFDFIQGKPADSLLADMGYKPRGWFKEAIHRLEGITRASDLAVRKAIYDQTVKEGGDALLAQTRAREFINFRRRGASELVGALVTTIPFFNAYVQGMDVLYRAASGIDSSSSVTRAQARKLFWNRAAAVTAMSMLYALGKDDDDEQYKEADLRTRDSNWFIGGQKISVPGELGAIFKVIPERIVEYYKRSGTPEEQDAFEAMRTALTYMYEQYVGRTVPIPQAAKPLLEAWTNYSFLTGRPLEGIHQRSMLPSQRRAEATSELALAISKFSKDQIGVEVSPIMIDNTLRGYFGSTAAMTTMVTDSLLNPTRVDRPLHKWALLSNYMIDPVGTRRLGEFYEEREKVGQLNTTLNDLAKTDIKAAEAFAEKHEGELAMNTYINATLEQLEQTRAYRKYLNSPDGAAEMSKDEREREIGEIRKYEVELVGWLREAKAMMRNESR